jgi:hypothetical protein
MELELPQEFGCAGDATALLHHIIEGLLPLAGLDGSDRRILIYRNVSHGLSVLNGVRTNAPF